MNYYIEKDGKIVLADNDKERLLNTLPFIPQYEGLLVQETEREIVSYDGELYFADEITDELLEAAKVMKLNENKEAYDKALKAGVEYKGSLFDCDTLAAVRVMGQLTAMNAAPVGESETIDWFDYEYKPVVLSADEFVGLAGLITLNTRRIETLNCGFNTAIQAAQTMEELEAIKISYADPSGTKDAK